VAPSASFWEEFDYGRGLHCIYENAAMKDGRIVGACTRKSYHVLHAHASGALLQ
jgi:hypothetical protein